MRAYRRHARSDYRIDFFPDANGSMAICLFYGTPGKQRIVVYDGGSPDTGFALLAYIQAQYGTSIVDDLICSHPNADHALGLWPILENMEVRKFWLHRPWAHTPLIARHVRGRDPNAAKTAHLDDRLIIAYALEKLALAQGAAVEEPFQGKWVGPFLALSPSREQYVRQLIPQFAYMQAVNLSGVQEAAPQRASAQFDLPVVSPLPDSWKKETLMEKGAVNAEMESSAVLFAAIGGQGILLTGNAGVGALSHAADYAEAQRTAMRPYLQFMQIPHYGNHRHVSPSVLNRLIGPALRKPAAISGLTAFVCTPQGESSYPHQSVVNALIRRGAQVAHIQAHTSHTSPFAQGDGRKRLKPMPFQPNVLLPFVDMPGLSLRVVDYQQDCWFLLSDGAELYLDVRGSYFGNSIYYVIRLNDEECKDYTLSGKSFIQALAEQVEKSWMTYANRNLSIQMQKHVDEVIVRWRIAGYPISR